MVHPIGRAFAQLALLATLAGSAAAVPPDSALLENGQPIRIRRASAPISLDGSLTDAAWADAARVENWVETRPADNTPATPQSLAMLAYDDTYLYVAFDLEDPDPASIRAPIRDRDDIPQTVDFAGLLIDPAGDGKLAQDFAGTPRGVQYDGVYSEASGPASSPDFYWDCVGAVNGKGWTLEMRIPFSSIRYADPNPSHWAILLYRNVPRTYRYEYYSSRIPRDRSCVMCNARALEGLENLPSGAHWVAAPYATASGLQSAEAGPGSALGSTENTTEAGFDLKWMPRPDTIVDATANPDFSQIESDAAQITANERFALSLPEKRPFFMESVDLFTTPITAVYTRTITSPRWGARTTGVGEGYTYTVLAGEDRGGGSVILPGPEGSSFAPQDLSSFFAIGRLRLDVGNSFASFLFTDRESDGGSYNRVLGPDFEWRYNDTDVVLGQFLMSWSRTPNRPDLAQEWNGSSLTGHAAELTWLRRTASWDATLSLQEASDEFRADSGFVPQVGYRKGYAEVGYTFWPQESAVTRLRLFTISSTISDQHGELLFRQVTPGFGFDSLLDSFVRFEFAFDEVRAGDRLVRRRQVRPTIRFTPGRLVSLVQLEGVVGDEVDWSEARPAEGATVKLTTELRPSDNLLLAVNLGRRWLDVESEGASSGRLFTADIARLRATYSFSVRSWLRLIAQWTETDHDPGLYKAAVEERSGDFAGSLTFAYKLNWQTVLFIGFADSRVLDDAEVLRRADREAFLKVSYALMR